MIYRRFQTRNYTTYKRRPVHPHVGPLAPTDFSRSGPARRAVAGFRAAGGFSPESPAPSSPSPIETRSILINKKKHNNNNPDPSYRDSLPIGQHRLPHTHTAVYINVINDRAAETNTRRTPIMIIVRRFFDNLFTRLDGNDGGNDRQRSATTAATIADDRRSRRFFKTSFRAPRT